MNHRLCLLACVVLLLVVTPVAPTRSDVAYAATGDDYPLPAGHFYSQAAGPNSPPGSGYAILDTGTDDHGQTIRFWSEFRRLGGVDVLGYPASRRFDCNGFICQATQRVILQWQPATNSANFLNVMDWMTSAGKDEYLLAFRQVPPPANFIDQERGLSFEQIRDRRYALLDAYPAIKARYFAASDPLAMNGLPTAPVTELGDAYVLRAQRIVIQQWKKDMPWAKAGEVTVALGGDLAKETGLIAAVDGQAVVPEPKPRLKQPPSPYKTLAGYPRPANDDGYGFHISASPNPPDPNVLREQVIPLLKQLHARWVTVWAADDNQVDRVKLLVDAGFEVVLRVHPQGAPHPWYVPDPAMVRRYTAIGVHYIVPGNEPNLKAENQGGRADPDAIAWQWVQASDNIKAGGGIPVLYPMSPGGDAMDSRVLLAHIFVWAKQHDMLDAFDGAAVAIHNRPMNKPLDVRDSTSFLDYEWVDDLVQSYMGRSLPLLGTEAGYTYNDLVDPRYPRITAAMHRDYNLAIVTGFRDGRWRDSLFCQNFWLLSGFGHYAFPADWWVGNPLYYGKDLPAVAALEQLPPFTRIFHGAHE